MHGFARDAPAVGWETVAAPDLAALYHAHYDALVRIAHAVTGDKHLAEDLAQEAFVRVSRSLGRLREPGAAGAYLRRAVVNLAKNSIRRRVLELRHRATRIETGAEPDRAESVGMVELLRKLPPRQRACVFLRYFEDMSEEEAARTLGISLGTVKSQTHKALRRLETLMGERDDDAD